MTAFNIIAHFQKELLNRTQAELISQRMQPLLLQNRAVNYVLGSSTHAIDIEHVLKGIGRK